MAAGDQGEELPHDGIGGGRSAQAALKMAQSGRPTLALDGDRAQLEEDERVIWPISDLSADSVVMLLARKLGANHVSLMPESGWSLPLPLPLLWWGRPVPDGNSRPIRKRASPQGRHAERPLPVTAQKLSVSYERKQSATRRVADSHISFEGALLKPFCSLSCSLGRL